jgi:hypothetical protein
MFKRVLSILTVMNFILFLVVALSFAEPVRRLPADKSGIASQENQPASSLGSAGQKGIRSEEEGEGPGQARTRVLMISGKVTLISGNAISITDGRGLQRSFEIDSTAGIKIGMNATCDGDCGRALKIGNRSVRVRRVK